LTFELFKKYKKIRKTVRRIKRLRKPVWFDIIKGLIISFEMDNLIYRETYDQEN
jgi:hypothetical protein